MKPPKLITMNSQSHFLHFTIFLLISPHYTFSSPTPNTSQFTNKTVYNQSKSLCFSCLSDAIQFLYAHNLIRLAHLEFPLIWDSQLEAYASWWAAQRKPDCRLQHSFPDGEFRLGENIFWGDGSNWRPGDAVWEWANEGKDYEYGSNKCAAGKVCGHYTQIVWRDTRRVGCARVECEDGNVFMTCNYYPPGNVVGERPY